MFKKYKLKTKILLSIIFSSFFLCIITSISIYFYLGNFLVNQKTEEINKLSIEQSHESIQIFEKNKIFAKMLGTRTRVKEFLLDSTEAKRKELLGIFSDYAKDDSKYLAIYLLDKNGIALISTDERFVGQDYSFRDYFKKALDGFPNVDVSIGKTSNQFGYYFSHPVKNEDSSVIGVLVVKIDNVEIDNVILNSEISKNSTTMLVDQYGIVLVSNKKERYLKSLGTLTSENTKIINETNRLLGKEIIPLQYNDVQEIVNNYRGQQTVKIFDVIDKEDEIISINKISDFPFYLVSEIGLEDINNLVFNLIYILLLLIILGVIFSAFILYYFIIKTIRPITQLKIIAEEISLGNFSKRIDINTKDEIGDLAQSFNKMAESLSNLYKNIELKVKEQTNEIKNKIKESDDQNKAILNILEDVEKEKNNAENLANDLEKFKLAVENASDQIVITDSEGIVLYGNKAVERITGYKPEEALGKKAGILWKVPMPKDYYENLWDIIKNKKKTFISEIQNKRKNGEVYTAIITISIVFDKDDNIIYFVAIERDITKEKEVDKAKTEFVSLASHQLRTPLSAINWYTEMLLAGDAGAINDEERRYLNEIAIGNKRMVDLVDDLLNVSRLDMGTFIVENKPINLLELIKNVLEENKPKIIEKKLKVEESYSEFISEFLADEKLLRMVFENLISNAIKYTPESGLLKINMSILNKGDNVNGKILDEKSLVFSVSDNGMGIPSNQQDKIFSKLFRANNAKESETEGTGLGLYVVKSITDQSGGSAWFVSVEGKGSTFHVAFPINGMKIKEKKN